MTDPSVRVAAVAEGSAAARAGLMPGVEIVALNGRPVRDLLELYFRESASRVDLELRGSDGVHRHVRIRKPPEAPLGITLEPTKDLVCREKCVFCFVHQNPKGLRRPLYFKDDDYRLSFLHGNFVTLTNAPEGAVERIIEQKLSPLYVSVHSSDPEVRGRLLGSRAAAPILPILERLRRGGITFYGQIVVCPGINDGDELRRTLRDLAFFYPSCPAVAVVPLGLTAHRGRLPLLRPFGPGEALDALGAVGQVQRELRREMGSRFAFLADEIYLQAGRPVPGHDHYEGFPILEDGVGMWRAFVDAWGRGLRRLPALPKGGPRLPRVTLVTGRLFAPTLSRLARELQTSAGITLRVLPAANTLFGSDITVAGLLSGRCVLQALREAGVATGETILVPGGMINEGGADGLTLDDLTIPRLSELSGTRVASGGRTARELLDILGLAMAESRVPLPRGRTA